LKLPTNRRILVVDDMRSIHEDFARILSPADEPSDLRAMEALLLGSPERERPIKFEVDSAYQGRDALAMVEKAKSEDRPYSVAIVDMLMPPGWNGIETIQNLLRADGRLRVVLCSAFCDPGWQQAAGSKQLLSELRILAKPFDPDEAVKLVASLAGQWGSPR
jgi:CheY-like chemotaxis protein